MSLFQKNQQVIKTCLRLLLSWLGTYGISYIYSLVSGIYFSNGILSVAVFIMIYKFLEMTEQNLNGLEAGKVRKRHIGYAFLIAYIFALTLVMGYQLYANGMTEYGIKGKGMILVHSFCLAFAVFPFSNILVNFADKYKNGDASIGTEKKGLRSSKLFLVCWGILFLCWIPVFLAYYPAVMAFDFHRQSVDAMNGFVWFYAHHPLIHTLLIWVFFRIGELFGSLQTGMAFYSIFQMLVLSAALTYVTVMVYRLTKRLWTLVVTLAFFAFFPFVSILSVGATKDVIFSALFAVFVCLLVEKALFQAGRRCWKLDLAIVLEGILMCMFRNNGLYAVAVFAIIFVILAAKKERIRVLLLCLALIIGSKGALEGIQLALGTQLRGNPIEKYSVLVQQFARVGYFYKDELDKETYELLDKYVSDIYWEDYYAPISDPVKGGVGGNNYSEHWEGKMSEVLNAWLTIGLKYPNEYIDAFLCLTSGFWFMDDITWAEVLNFEGTERKGALHTFNSTVSEQIPEGIASEPKFPQLESFLEQIVSENCFYKWPVVSNIFKPALYCWILMLCCLLYIYTKQKEKCLITCYPLAYLLTMYLGPVVQVRYVLPIIVVIPVMLAMWSYRMAEKTEDSEVVSGKKAKCLKFRKGK